MWEDGGRWGWVSGGGRAVGIAGSALCPACRVCQVHVACALHVARALRVVGGVCHRRGVGGWRAMEWRVIRACIRLVLNPCVFTRLASSTPSPISPNLSPLVIYRSHTTTLTPSLLLRPPPTTRVLTRSRLLPPVPDSPPGPCHRFVERPHLHERSQNRCLPPAALCSPHERYVRHPRLRPRHRVMTGQSGKRRSFPCYCVFIRLHGGVGGASHTRVPSYICYLVPKHAEYLFFSLLASLK